MAGDEAAAKPERAADRLRGITVGLGCVVFLVTAIWIATSPVGLTV